MRRLEERRKRASNNLCCMCVCVDDTTSAKDEWFLYPYGRLILQSLHRPCSTPIRSLELLSRCFSSLVDHAHPADCPGSLSPDNVLLSGSHTWTAERCGWHGNIACRWLLLIIVSPPFQVHSEYFVLFEDNTYSDGYSPPLEVPQRYVLPMRETRRKQ